MARAHQLQWQPSRLATAAEPELMEQPGQEAGLVAGALDDLRRINRWLGGTRLTIWGVERLASRLEPGSALSVLDVATGGADIPREVHRWASRRGLAANCYATDLNPRILSLASPESRNGLGLFAADGRKLPLEDSSIDIATCSLVVHHFDPKDAIAFLRELRRVARLGIVVNDLVRSRHGLIGAWLVGHLLTQNPVTRHDATLSVRRAYTPAELEALARQAGLGPVTFTDYLGYRVAMVAGPWG